MDAALLGVQLSRHISEEFCGVGIGGFIGKFQFHIIDVCCCGTCGIGPYTTVNFVDVGGSSDGIDNVLGCGEDFGIDVIFYFCNGG